MRIAFLFISLGIILAGASASCAQDKKLPDYTSKSVEKWIEALQDPNAELRAQAIRALGPKGPYAKVAVEALIESFAQEQPHTKASEVLIEYGASAGPSLIRALKRPETSVKAHVASVLGQIRPKLVEAVPAVIQAMKDHAPEVRAAASWSLACIGPKGDKAILSLTTALRDNNDQVQEAAALALERIGPDAKAAVPGLIEGFQSNKNARVRSQFAQALGSIKAKEAVPALIKAVQEKDDKISGWAASALGEIGPDARAAVPALIAAVQDKSNSERQSAIWALGMIGPGARAAVPALIAAAQDKDRMERIGAVQALGMIGPDARAAVPVLIKALENESDEDCSAVAHALGGIGPAAKAAVPALSEIARDRLAGSSSRQGAAEAVMKIDAEFAARQGMELAYLNIRLGKIPPIKLAPRAALNEEKRNRIKRLIAELADMKDPDIGMSATVNGRVFAALPELGQAQVGLLTDHRLKRTGALRDLVEIGPEALPFLLERLGDKTPTKLDLEPVVGMMFFASELEGNPLNPWERRVLAKETPHGPHEDGDSPTSYLLKVGDVCFVAIGQIVGRSYCAVRYQPSGMVIINSPLERDELRERVRRIWSSNDPVNKLLDSLLIDYATEALFNGKSLDGWRGGSDYQVQAAIRLLYYFPRETSALIAKRLRSLDVQTGGPAEEMKREVKNGVYTEEFIKAVTWCKDPAIQEALAGIAKRTNDPQIKEALEFIEKKNP